MAQKTEPRNSSIDFIGLLLTCRCYGRVKIFLSGAIVEVGLGWRPERPFHNMWAGPLSERGAAEYRGSSGESFRLDWMNNAARS